MGRVTFNMFAVIGTAILWNPSYVFSVTCGQNPPANDESGIVSSFSYPHAYGRGATCKTTIKVPQGFVIKLKFYSPFEISGYDYLQATERDETTGGTIQTKWQGESVPPVYMSVTNSVELYFQYDFYESEGTSKGFRLLWEKMDSTIMCGINPLRHVGRGYIASPGYPNAYGNGERCKTVLTVPPGNVIRLLFSQPFQLQYNHDYLKVFDVNSSGKKTNTRSWTGNAVPPVYTSSTNNVVLYFTSDDSVVSKGFRLFWERKEISKICGGFYQSPNGTFSSPGFPNPYPADLNCTWEIHVAPGNSVQLEFGSPFDIEMENHGCNYDSLEVIDFLPNDEQILQGKWCGLRKPAVSNSISPKLLVVFTSDNDKSGQGFTASWKTVNPPLSQQCNVVYNSINGSFTTPGFPNLSPPKLNCQWKINLAQGRRIKLELGTHPDVGADDGDCRYDYVEVFDFFTNGTQISNGRWCSFRKVPVIYSISSKMVVVFKSPNNGSRQGFNASWESVSGCGEKISSGAGHLLSPNFPKQYPLNEECRWELTPPVGTNFTLRFDTIFDLELSNSCAWDYLQITLDGSSIGKYCGNNRPQDVKVTGGQKLDIVFKSDKSTTGKGFFASWTYDK